LEEDSEGIVRDRVSGEAVEPSGPSKSLALPRSAETVEFSDDENEGNGPIEGGDLAALREEEGPVLGSDSLSLTNNLPLPDGGNASIHPIEPSVEIDEVNVDALPMARQPSNPVSDLSMDLGLNPDSPHSPNRSETLYASPHMTPSIHVVEMADSPRSSHADDIRPSYRRNEGGDHSPRSFFYNFHYGNRNPSYGPIQPSTTGVGLGIVGERGTPTMMEGIEEGAEEEDSDKENSIPDSDKENFILDLD